jgi:hypothetical protein
VKGNKAPILTVSAAMTGEEISNINMTNAAPTENPTILFFISEPPLGFKLPS